MNPIMLQQENQHFQYTGGLSRQNRDQGFRPAFSDTATGCVYLSCFANGSPAPFHLLDGLPDQVVLQRDPAGRNTATRATVIAGFVRGGQFYTRAQAARMVASTAAL